MSPMDLQPAPEKQRYLTPEVFASFLLWLSPDPGRAAREYLDIRKTLMKFFVRKGCAHAEELTDRTLDRVVADCAPRARKVPDTYLPLLRRRQEESGWSISGSQRPKHWRTRIFRRPLSRRMSLPKTKCNAWEHCLDQLPVRDRELITQYHQFQGRRKD